MSVAMKAFGIGICVIFVFFFLSDIIPTMHAFERDSESAMAQGMPMATSHMRASFAGAPSLMHAERAKAYVEDAVLTLSAPTAGNADGGGAAPDDVARMVVRNAQLSLTVQTLKPALDIVRSCNVVVVRFSPHCGVALPQVLFLFLFLFAFFPLTGCGSGHGAREGAGRLCSERVRHAAVCVCHSASARRTTGRVPRRCTRLAPCDVGCCCFVLLLLSCLLARIRFRLTLGSFGCFG